MAIDSKKYGSHEAFFERAYRTGTDVWTHFAYTKKGNELSIVLSAGAMILDVGAGRGLWPFMLADQGFKVIGLELVAEIVKKNNEEVKAKGLAGIVGFMQGSVFDIPLADTSFDAVTDFGLFQHIKEDDEAQYKKEILRVLKPGGYYLNVSLSRETKTFLTFHPKAMDGENFEHDGLLYRFFTKEDMVQKFEKEFTVISQRLDNLESHDPLVYVVTLFRKK